MGDVCLLIESSERRAISGNPQKSEKCIAHPIAPFVVRGVRAPFVVSPCLIPLLKSLHASCVVVFDVLRHRSKPPNLWQPLPPEREACADAVICLLISNEIEAPSPPLSTASSPPETPMKGRQQRTETPSSTEGSQTLMPDQSEGRDIEQAKTALQSHWELAISPAQLRGWPLSIYERIEDEAENSTIASLIDGYLNPRKRARLSKTLRELQIDSTIAAVRKALLEKHGSLAGDGREQHASSWGSIKETQVTESGTGERTTTSDTRVSNMTDDDDDWGLPRISQPPKRKRRSTESVSQTGTKLPRVSVAEASWTAERPSISASPSILIRRKDCELRDYILRICQEGESVPSLEINKDEQLVLQAFEKWQKLPLTSSEKSNVIRWILSRERIPARLHLSLLLCDSDVSVLSESPLYPVVHGDVSNLPSGCSKKARGLWATILDHAYQTMETCIAVADASESSLLKHVPLFLLPLDRRSQLSHTKTSLHFLYDTMDRAELVGALDDVCLVITDCMKATCTEVAETIDLKLWIWSVSAEVWAKVLGCLRGGVPTTVLAYLFTCHVCMCEITMTHLFCDKRPYEDVVKDTKRDWSNLYQCSHPKFFQIYQRMHQQSVVENLRSAWDSLASLMRNTGEYDNIVDNFSSPWSPTNRLIHRRGHLVEPFANSSRLVIDISLQSLCPFHPLICLAQSSQPVSSMWAKWLLTQNILNINLKDKRILAQDLWVTNHTCSHNRTHPATIAHTYACG